MAKSTVKSGIPAELKKLKDLLYQWIDDTDKAVEELNNLAKNLDEHFNRISYTKVGGASAAVTGGLLATGGLILAPFTGGASLLATLAGGVIGGAGGATTGGCMIVDAVLSSNRRKSCEEILQKYKAQTEAVRLKCAQISEDLQQYGNMDQCFPEWVNFWAKLLLGSAACAKRVCWDMVGRTIMTGFQLANYGDHLARSGAGVAATAIRTAGAAGKVVRVVGGVAGILFLPLDIYTLVDSAIDVHKNNPHQVSEGIREAAKKLEAETPTKEAVNRMLDKTAQACGNRR